MRAAGNGAEEGPQAQADQSHQPEKGAQRRTADGPRPAEAARLHAPGQAHGPLDGVLEDGDDDRQQGAGAPTGVVDGADAPQIDEQPVAFAIIIVYQTIHLDGIIIVTTPQDLVGMIVEKSIKMANKMNIEILGIIENMSYFKCDECGKKIKVFGEGNISYLSDKFGIKKFAKLPLDPEFSKLCDRGMGVVAGRAVSSM